MFKDINKFDTVPFMESFLNEKLAVYSKKEYANAAVATAILQQYDVTVQTVSRLETALVSAYPVPVT